MVTSRFKLSDLEIEKLWYEYKSVDLVGFVGLMVMDLVPDWRSKGLLKAGNSYAVVVADLGCVGQYKTVYNRPKLLGGFAVGFGGDAVDLHCYNALRKMRATAREGLGSLLMKEELPAMFQDVVVPVSDDPLDPYPWGDLAEGGAVLLGKDRDPHQVLVGVDGFDDTENHILATTVGMMLRKQMKSLSRVA
jgi:hypothetical protein